MRKSRYSGCTHYFFAFLGVLMENNNSFILAEQPIGRLMRKYAVPCIISLLVGALYNIVDQIYIANASRCV